MDRNKALEILRDHRVEVGMDPRPYEEIIIGLGLIPTKAGEVIVAEPEPSDTKLDLQAHNMTVNVQPERPPYFAR